MALQRKKNGKAGRLSTVSTVGDCPKAKGPEGGGPWGLVGEKARGGEREKEKRREEGS